jgi:hypothetical protein
MTAANFDRALTLVLQSEGGYADDPRDPGGATNRGITRATLARWRGRPVSKAELRALGRAEAAAIYRALYWDALRGDDLPAGLDIALFDYGVNSGPARAARTLQAVLASRSTASSARAPWRRHGQRRPSAWCGRSAPAASACWSGCAISRCSAAAGAPASRAPRPPRSPASRRRHDPPFIARRTT